MMIITCFSLKIYNACPAKMAFIFMCDINSLHLQNTPNSKQKKQKTKQNKRSRYNPVVEDENDIHC